MRLSPDLLFRTGEARLLAGDERVLAALAKSVGKLPHNVRVTGHGDRFFLPSRRYPSNRRLAMARASAACAFLNRRGLASDRLQAAARPTDLDPKGASLEVLIMRRPDGGLKL